MLSRLCHRSFVGNGSGFYIARAINGANVRTLHGSNDLRSDSDRYSSVKSTRKWDLRSFSRQSVRWNSTIPQDFAMAKSQLLEGLKGVKLKDAKDAPVPIFWTGVAGMVPIVVPPLTFLLFGYSQSLATIQVRSITNLRESPSSTLTEQTSTLHAVTGGSFTITFQQTDGNSAAVTAFTFQLL